MRPLIPLIHSLPIFPREPVPEVPKTMVMTLERFDEIISKMEDARRACGRCFGTGRYSNTVIVLDSVLPEDGGQTSRYEPTMACTACRAHELAWQPYYDEQRRYWLAKRAKS